MSFTRIALLAGVSLAISTTTHAQFSVSGGGSTIPASGTGGDAAVAGDGGATYDTTQAGLEAISTVVVANPVTSITSIEIDGLAHTWVGDTQATLGDPNGVEHLIWLRPGYLNTSGFGNSGDFDGGNYTFVGDGSGMNLPTDSNTATIPAGTYNQTFSSGGTTWVSGMNGINNTPMNSITGPAGTWSLRIYDWAGGDSGSFSGWTLNGLDGGNQNNGAAYCFGDGTGGQCPCGANGGAGEGCMTTSGSGATLAGAGNADTSADTFVLSVSGGPAGKPGLFFQGSNATVTPMGDGIMCSDIGVRWGVQFLSGTGTVNRAGLGSGAQPGSSINYQYWFRDPGNTCGGGFNYSNGWNVTWM